MFCFVPAHLPHTGTGVFSPTNLDRAKILSRTDFDFDKCLGFDVDRNFLDSQIPRFLDVLPIQTYPTFWGRPYFYYATFWAELI